MKKAFFQLHAAVFLAGFTGVLGRLISLNEALLVWYRLIITCMALWAIYYFSSSSKKIDSSTRLKAYGVGAVVALHWVTFYGSIKYSNVSIALVCFSSIAFFTAILEPLLLKKKASLVELVLGLLTIAGIAVIFHFDSRYKTGILVGIFSAFLAGLFPVFNRALVQQTDSETLTREELTGGLFALTLILPAYLYLFPAQQFLPTLSDLGWLLVLSLLCTVLAFNLSMRALKKISAFTVNLSFNLEPVYGILLAFMIYREDRFLAGNFYLGLSLILLSVILQSLLVLKRNR